MSPVSFAVRKRRDDVITLTDSATVKVKELLEAEGANELALRVAVRPGGCSGFSYEMFFDGDV
ncbi:MAG: HesB/IscA family protein, partial [Ilumatobacteraceae bacterium]